MAILNDSSLYLLLGFAMAGLLHVAMNRYRKFTSVLTQRGRRPVFLASILGLPLPLCSCSVIPAGLALRREGASKGTVSSFLISVPETDIASILLTYGLLGPAVAIVRPIAALATAIITGLAVDAVDSRGAKRETSADDAVPPHATHEHHHHDTSAMHWTRRALHYGFREFFDDLALPLITGIVIAGAIATWLPGLEIVAQFDGTLIPYVAMLMLGIPMYVCATASTPIAAGLIVGGVSPGAALVFLLAGPATNVANLYMLRRPFGAAALAAYLTCIASLSLLAGFGLDLVLGSATVGSIAVDVARAEGATAWQWTGTAVFVILTLASLIRTRVLSRRDDPTISRGDAHTPPQEEPSTTALAAPTRLD